MAFQDFITKCYKQKIHVPYRSENIIGEALGYSWNGNMSQSGSSLKVDSHMLRHPAARHDAVRHDAAKMHGSCSHIQRVPL